LSQATEADPTFESVIGFDARAAWLDPDERWDAARRATYLLRPDVERPLSIDRLVWPAVATRASGPYPLWTDVAALSVDVADEGTHAGGPFWIVAFSLVVRSRTDEEWHLWEPLLSASGMLGQAPVLPDRSWGVLGYDVADLALLSGLTNCGYAPTSAQSMRTTWARRLNAHHLFATGGDAYAFKPVTDARVPEHAPFAVFGVYRVA
jgi:hypothetical protein